MTEVPLAELVRGNGLRGATPEPLSAALCARAGRAFGTLLRQRTSGGARRVVVGRAQDSDLLHVRDGLVRGLVLAGHHVVDLGACPEATFGTALQEAGMDAGLWMAPTDDGAQGITFFLGPQPLVGEALAALCMVGDSGRFSSGVGSLELRGGRATPQSPLKGEAAP